MLIKNKIFCMLVNKQIFFYYDDLFLLVCIGMCYFVDVYVMLIEWRGKGF